MKARWPEKILLVVNVLFVIGLLLSYLSTVISPLTSNVLPFFGLAYPIFLIVNLVFIVIWFFLRKWYMLIPAVPLLFGIGFFLDFWQFSSDGSPLDKSRKQLRIMSYNVRLFDLYNWSENEKTRNRMFAQIHKTNPDIICFQEFYHRDMPGFFETRDTLITFLKATHVHEHYTHHMKSKQHFGLATFSAFPIVNKGEILFGNDPNNHCIYSDLKVEEDTIRVYNVHFSSIRFQHGDNYLQMLKRLSNAYTKRVDQAKHVLDHIRSSEYPVMICGDFNDTPISYCYNRFNTVLNDAFKESGRGIGSTYIGAFPGLRIDYIFHDDRFHSYQFRRHDEAYSDHHAISCMVELL